MSCRRSWAILSTFLKVTKVSSLSLNYIPATRKIKKPKRIPSTFWYMAAIIFIQFSAFVYFTFFNTRNNKHFDPETKLFRQIMSYFLGGLMLLSIATTYTVVGYGNRFVDLFNLWSEILGKDQSFWK